MNTSLFYYYVQTLYNKFYVNISIFMQMLTKKLIFFCSGVAMPCHTRMKIIFLQGELQIFTLGGQLFVLFLYKNCEINNFFIFCFYQGYQFLSNLLTFKIVCKTLFLQNDNNILLYCLFKIILN